MPSRIVGHVEVLLSIIGGLHPQQWARQERYEPTVVCPLLYIKPS